MNNDTEIDTANLRVAHRWCEQRGQGWSVSEGDPLGKGATASVYEIVSPDGLRSLKICSAKFSTGPQREVGQKRIEQQVALGVHNCPSLVQVYEGGEFEDRLYLLMTRAPGKELEKCLRDIPRNRIRQIVDQVARAVLFLNSKGQCHRDIKAANVFVSDDYSQAMLLDISVLRDIHDPLGVGTDHDGQLPVVATTRYTPPEYLFRLEEPGPELWHALNIYQLGALLHDLIMKEPLFEAEHLKSAENRYRLAWAVATTIPNTTADDVDKDLVFTAQRALDKDWKRRSSLRVEDFLADPNVLQLQALKFLGLSTERETIGQNDLVTARFQRILDISRRLKEDVRQYLSKNSVTAIHEVTAGANDISKVLTFRWDAAPGEAETYSQRIEFQLGLQLLLRNGGYCFVLSASLSTQVGEGERRVAMEIPELPDELGIESALASQAESAFEKLAVEIIRADTAVMEE